MAKKLLQVSRMTSFLNKLSDDIVEQLLDDPHERINMPTFTLHVLKLSSKDYFHKAKIYVFESVNKIEEEDLKDLFLFHPELDKHTLMISTVTFNPNIFNYASEEKISAIPGIISYIHDEKPELAKTLKEKCDDYCLNNALDVVILEDSVIRLTSQLKNYLEDKKIIKNIAPITIDDDSSDKEVEDWFNNLEEQDIPYYGDADFYPFIYNDFFVIEDIMVNKLFICKKNNDGFTWYQTERNFEVDNVNSDIVYESGLYVKHLTENACIDINKILTIENNKIVQVSPDFEHLESVLEIIAKKLVKQKEIEPLITKLSFEDLVKNYAIQKEIWHIEERAFSEVLEKLCYVNDTLSYEDFKYIKDKDSVKIKNEDSKYFYNLLKRTNIENISLLKKEDKYEIMAYVEKLIAKYPAQSAAEEDIANSFIDKINELSIQEKKKIKP